MNPALGWAMALVALAAGWRGYGWPGVPLALTVIAFWLLIQFNRSLRVMRDAGQTPVGHVDSAVMLNAKLAPGMPMMKVVTLTKSLGKRVAETPETWAWSDASGSDVTIVFERGCCKRWDLRRPAE